MLAHSKKTGILSGGSNKASQILRMLSPNRFIKEYVPPSLVCGRKLNSS